MKLSAVRSELGRVPLPIRVFWTMNVVLGLTCLIFESVWRWIYYWPLPFRSPVLGFAHFTDLNRFQSRFANLHSPAFFSKNYQWDFMYPAPIALLYGSLYSTKFPTIAYFGVTGALIVVLLGLFGLAMKRSGVNTVVCAAFVISLPLMSFPLWFAYSLANMETCVFLIVGFGILAFVSGRYAIAATLFGAAGAMKLFPFVLFALLLTKRAYRAFAFGLLVAVGLNLLALWVICPPISFAYRGIAVELAKFREQYMLPFLPLETGLDHSGFGFIKAALARFYHGVMPSYFLSSYLAAAAVLGLTLYFFAIRKLPILNQLIALSILEVFLPPTSHDYTLLQLYVPFCLLVLFVLQFDRKRRSKATLISVFTCFGLLFSAESELIVHHWGRSGQLKCGTLVALFVLVLRNRWEWSYLDG